MKYSLFFLFFLYSCLGNSQQKNKVSCVDLNNAYLCDFPKYYELFHENHAISVYFELEQGLKCAKQHKRPILLMFDGWGNSRSREMNNTVFSDEKIKNYLAENFLTVCLYVDDNTELPQEEWIKSRATGKLQKTIGAKNIEIQTTTLRTSSQPCFVILDYNESLISKVKYFTSSKNIFFNWLKDGKESFAKLHYLD